MTDRVADGNTFCLAYMEKYKRLNHARKAAGRERETERKGARLKLFVTEAKDRAEGTPNNPTTSIGFGGAMNRHS